MVTEFSAFSATDFECFYCDIVCRRKNDWARHILTRKHINNASGNTFSATNVFQCDFCQKPYKSRKGLWSHNKLCNTPLIIGTHPPTGMAEVFYEPQAKCVDIGVNLGKDKVIELLIKENSEFKNIVLDMVKSNAELQKQLIDVCKNNSINTINSNNNNNNKTFNLQFFLNEQCKDAMNISDFANTIDLQLEDLESVGELGYVDGISKIIVDKLNGMDIYKRPMHCSDSKREIIYIKDENIWTKEEKGNPKLRQTIKNVSFRNMKLVYNWSNTYPESKNNESRLNDKYMKLVIESTGGTGSIMDSENKIIRRIVKEIFIEKK